MPQIKITSADDVTRSLALYVHIPWCVRKCPYCDFNSHPLERQFATTKGLRSPAVVTTEDEGKTTVQIERLYSNYTAALLGDLEYVLPMVAHRPVGSIFIGGGTPSLMPPPMLAGLLQAIDDSFQLAPNVEITLEANPGAAGNFATFAALGVNRLSLGVQSFNDHHLAAIGRIHDAKQAITAAQNVTLHFANFNIDIMFALPGQSHEEVEQDIAMALSFAPPHLSCYQLTVEPNTPFATKLPHDLPDTDSAASMGDTVAAMLVAAGYEHYEVSAFARPGQRCCHNMSYWQFDDYLGLGAGAHSKLSEIKDAASPLLVRRQMRHKHPALYMQNSPPRIQEEWLLNSQEVVLEYLMNALRLQDGFSYAQFGRQTGLNAQLLESTLAGALKKGLLNVNSQHVKTTTLGQRYLNRLLLDLV